MTVVAWVLTVVLVLVALAGWLSATAQRVDRLHRRVETSRAALDAELTRRASAALEFALESSDHLDPASALLLADAATTSLDAPRTPAALREVNDADDAHRWRVESDLTRALAVALPVPDGAGPDGTGPDGTGHDGTGHDGAGLARVLDASHRVRLARRFHNDAVVQTRRLRGKRIVRWGHLAGRARLPETADFLDGEGDGTGS